MEMFQTATAVMDIVVDTVFLFFSGNTLLFARTCVENTYNQYISYLFKY